MYLTCVYIIYIYIICMKSIYIVLAYSKKHQKTATWEFLRVFFEKKKNSAMQLSAEDRSCKAQYHDADLMGTPPGCHVFQKIAGVVVVKGAAKKKTLIPHSILLVGL